MLLSVMNVEIINKYHHWQRWGVEYVHHVQLLANQNPSAAELIPVKIHVCGCYSHNHADLLYVALL